MTRVKKGRRPAEARAAHSSDSVPRLMDWYRAAGRHSLPWRFSRDPYAVLVSEVMLQQTQVSRVIPAYGAWLARWPHVSNLAAASQGDVIRQWSGLGYNRRALNVHRAASILLATGAATVPVDPALLVTFPGIGRYTAGAVASFAGELPVPVVDTNIARVLARHYVGLGSVRDASPSRLWHLAAELLPAAGPAARHHNLALMDLGATLCRSAAPSCGSCPVANSCRWLLAGRPAPTAGASVAPRFETTDRFARGRIIDALRRAPHSHEDLSTLLPLPHSTETARLLCGLERDGLVVRSAVGLWTLPGDD